MTGTSGARDVAGVIVSLNPADDAVQAWASFASQVAKLIVVDNGTPEAKQGAMAARLREIGAEFVPNRTNLGVARALNQGLERAEQSGFRWAVTLDQDSRPQPGMVAALLACACAEPEPARVALVGARIVEERFPNRPERWLTPSPWGIGYRFVPCRGGDLRGVTLVITSGTLTSISDWKALGGFDEGLFVDYVDFDFALRVRSAGLEIVVSEKAVLHHSLGSKREVSCFGYRFHPTFHSPVRHYYMARNRLLLWRRYGFRQPHWWIFDAYSAVRNLVRVLLVEDRRKEKLLAFIRGVGDGLRGRTGPMP